MLAALNADQLAIQEEAERFLNERVSPGALRRIGAEGAGLDRDLWASVSEELGWCGIAVPEKDGGLGLSMVELALLLEQTGRKLACLPLWSTTCLAVPLLLAGAGADARARLLPWIVSGRVAATVAAPALGTAFARDPAPVRAEQDRTGFILDGEVAQVPNLASAGLVLVPARLGDGMALFALQPEHGHIVSPLRVLDVSRPCATLGLNHLRVDADSRIDAGGLQRGALATTAIWAKLGLAAEQVGAAQGALDVTLAYIRERVQFGRTIASFQAIKHRCARLTVDIAEARSLVYGAAALLAAQGPTPDVTHEVAAARVLATDVQFLAAEESLQLHGGVGFTWEYDPHFFLKRAQADAARLGGRDSELDAIADWLFDDGVAA